MSINTLFYGLVFITLDEVLVRASGISGIGDDGGSLNPYNTGEQEVEPFEFATLKRDENGNGKAKVPGAGYFRLGRNHVEEMPEEAEREARGRSDSFIRFGRSHPKASHHKNEPGFGGFGRIERGNKWVRMGRNARSNNENEISASYEFLKMDKENCQIALNRCHSRVLDFCRADDNDKETCIYYEKSGATVCQKHD
ncbi:uncharacterized protein LOC124412445 [Diprion similis]|uniref:uncharacterized protein LOC124412445 n=1 Tax=Diprion similis TaxID=362088 RepID=UPI001EF7DB1A|nr:uncharacterized protein LOC124412445 [Diprion similis]